MWNELSLKNEMDSTNLDLEALVVKLRNEAALHVWMVEKEKYLKPQLRAYSKLLSKEELARARGFRFENDRSTFILARGVLRLLLSHYTSIPSHQITIGFGHFGKPLLKGDQMVAFNMSHSKEVIVLAFSMHGEIGIDIEHLNPAIDHTKVAKTVFSQKEIDFLKAQPPREQIRYFYHFWTRKEALVKLLGYGLSMPVALSSISVLDDMVALPINRTGDKRNQGGNCHLRSYCPKQKYLCAIATSKAHKTIDFMKWGDLKLQP